nr:MAG TPA: hypothetical protein [Caudoviricetes sp.]
MSAYRKKNRLSSCIERQPVEENPIGSLFSKKSPRILEKSFCFAN